MTPEQTQINEPTRHATICCHLLFVAFHPISIYCYDYLFELLLFIYIVVMSWSASHGQEPHCRRHCTNTEQVS